MKGRPGLYVTELAVMIAAIAAVTVLGLYDKLTGEALTLIVGIIVGGVFGAASASAGATNATRGLGELSGKERALLAEFRRELHEEG